MLGSRLVLRACGLILLITQACPAFDGKNSYVYESAVQEASSSHVLLGTLRAFHLIKSELAPSAVVSGPTVRQYVAELEVARVEKGSGVQPGDVVYVRFHTSIADEDLQYGTIAGGCGEINFKINPGHGHEARVYALLNDNYQYVADYPASFYRISLKHTKHKSGFAAQIITVQTASMIGTTAVLLGLVLGFGLRGHRERKRMARMIETGSSARSSAP